MKKLIYLLLLLPIFLSAQNTSRYRIKNSSKFGWGQKIVPVKSYSDSTFNSIAILSDSSQQLKVGPLYIGNGTNSDIYLNNANSGKQLAIHSNSAGTNVVTLILGGTGSLTNFQTTAPAWSFDHNVRFDTPGAAGLYVNNGGLGMTLNGRNDVSGNYGITILDDGSTGIKNPLPTAKLHIAAGTSVAATAPIKLSVAGASLMTTPESGAIEVDANGTLYYSPDGTRYQVATVYTQTVTLDFPNTAPNASSDLTMTVSGAANTDALYMGVGSAAMAGNGGIFFSWVSAPNTVTIRFHNSTGGAIDPASAVFKVAVNKSF